MSLSVRKGPELLALSGRAVPVDHLLTPRGFETLNSAIERLEFTQWVLANASALTREQWGSVVSNLAPFGQAGRQKFREVWQYSGQPEPDGDALFQEAREGYEAGQKPAPYSVLQYQGFQVENPANSESPAADVRKLRREADKAVRGLQINEKGKVLFNPNVFVKYVLTRITLVLCNGGFYIYDHNAGVYHEISVGNLSKLCMVIMHEAQDNIWRSGYASQYQEALMLHVRQVAEMNPYRNVLNLHNCVLDIDSGAVSGHSPELLSTVQVPIDYDPSAGCPGFKTFLSDVMEGDEERIQLLQEILGWLLTSDNRIQKAFYFWGEGANGKSVLAEVIRHLCGIENVSNVPLSELGGRFGMQNLPGKTVNISTENEFSGKQVNSQTFKAIVGGDAVNIEKKYKDSYSTKLTVKLVILLNSLPLTEDLSHGFFRRLLFVPFRRTFHDLEADKGMLAKLLPELTGILNFALEGLRRLAANDYNFTESQAANEAHQQYVRTQNPVGEFCEDRIVASVGVSLRRTEFQRAFNQWCLENGHTEWVRVPSQKFLGLFRNSLTRQRFTFREKKVNGIMYVEGITVKGFHADAEQDKDSILHF